MQRKINLGEGQLTDMLKLGAAYFQMLGDLDRRGIEPPPFDLDIIRFVLNITGIGAGNEHGLDLDDWYDECFEVMTSFTEERGRDLVRRLLNAA